MDPDIAEQSGELWTPQLPPGALPPEGGLFLHSPDRLAVTAEDTSWEKILQNGHRTLQY